MTSHRPRPMPLALGGLTAVFSVLVALALFGGHPGHADAAAGHADHAAHAAATPTGSISADELALRYAMRKLWEDHVTWTRTAVISLTTDSPDTQATVARLLRNQADIGNAMASFYGDRTGRRLTHLLRDHILIAADIIAAGRAGDADALAAGQAKWRADAADIARFLHRANPDNWPRRAVRLMLDKHLRLTTQEVVARLQGDWKADVIAYDRIHRHALEMADTLSAGLVAQFPGRFG